MVPPQVLVHLQYPARPINMKLKNKIGIEEKEKRRKKNTK